VPRAADKGEPAEAGPPRQPFGDRCVGQPSRSRDGMLVACDDKQVMFIVPGTDWDVRTTPSADLGVSASAGPLNVSVRVLNAGVSAQEVSVYLESRYQDLVAKKASIKAQLEAQMLEIGPPHFEEETDHLVLCYDLTMKFLNGPLVRQVNVVTVLRRPDRRFVSFHMSELEPAESVKGDTKGRLVSFAGSFVVTDGNGNLPPQ
jgi:hypothetical protein